ncbi:solute carrier family 17 member 9 [Nasonia vitripennis]|uniref:Major facilitator superfamily (MFS) profile domain-containing protein n=1 Tax=Nasonia vitripennis TaxID=7425 RepID=A0A7M7Q585_NASVI|nr:solute carrier family 17 member 9 [Nasonia vitripennis]
MQNRRILTTVLMPHSSKSVQTHDSINLHWTRKERLKWSIILLSGTCLVYATRTSVPLLVPIIGKEREWSKTDSGTVLSSFFWGYTMTQVLGGYVSDRIGGQRIMWIAAIGWGISTFLLPDIISLFSKDDAYSIETIAFARLINGAFQGMHFPSMISLTSQRLSEGERASFFSLVTSGSALGTLLTGVLGSYVLESYKWDTVFRLLGCISVAWTFVLIYYSLLLNGRTTTNKQSSSNKLPIRELITKAPFWSCVIGHACQNNCFFILLSWMPTYFHDTFPEVKSWIVNMVPWLASVPSIFLGRAISEKLIKTGYSITATRKIIQTTCFTIQAINLLFLAATNSSDKAILYVTLIIAGSGFHNSAIVVNPSDLAPKHSGSVFGFMNTIGAVPGFLGVYFAGHILHLTHSWAVVFLYMFVIEIIGCAVYLIFGSGQAIL